MQILLQHIAPGYQVPQEARKAMEDAFVQKHFVKNDMLIKEEQLCRHLYFLEKGCIRGFYNIDGKDVSQWFGFENDFVTSFSSFITRKPAMEFIQLVEDSSLWCINHEQLDELLVSFPELERSVRQVYEQYYIRLEERYSNAHFKTATERYNNLLLYAPHILTRMPLGYIASYLGISAETLSRIRKKNNG